MAEQRGTLGSIAATLADTVLPVETRFEPVSLRGFLAELGLEFPPAIDSNAALNNAAGTAIQRVKDLPAIVTALTDAVEAEDAVASLAKGLELAFAVFSVVTEVEKTANAIKTLPGTGIPQSELNQFADEFPGRLLDYLIVQRLEDVGGLSEVFDFIGFVEITDVPASGPGHPAFRRRALHFDQLIDFINDPAGRLRAMYQWGDAGFDGTLLLTKIATLLDRAGLPAVLDTTGPLPVLEVFANEISPKLDVNPKGLQIETGFPLSLTPPPFITNGWEFRLILEAQLSAGLRIILQPGEGVTFQPSSGKVEGDLTLELKRKNADAAPYTLLGEPGGSRLEARELIARAGVGLAWNGGANKAEGTFKIEGEVKGGKLVVSLASADGFLGSILAGFGLESDFDLGVGFSSKEGLFFKGSATLDIQLPLHIQLGPVEISALTLTVGIQDNKFPIGLRTNIKAMLGPLQGVVEQIGVGADIAVPDDRKGNAGPVDFTLRFLPPKGVGLSIDVGVVKGGGYLFIDPDRGEYAGALELALFQVVTIKAIGIITTKMPDGSKGFSLLIIMSVEFGTGIQLGFGFTLLAVGGLLGLNRTMNLQALAEGIRSGAIESVMFPQDIIANAPKIISDLRTFFPPYQDRFLIGPMVKIGWGTPTLISLSLGIIIEIPGNIAIVGILQVALPTRDAALIKLQVNFIGAIEFDKKRVWFFAALFDSRVLFLTIEGEMGLLMAFGDDANFVVSVGGFHPRFLPPPLPFPSPRRIAINILNTPVARVRVEGYFAVTSNTVQFGASVEIFFGFDILNVQGHLGFDALFQFSPFYFIIEISASFSVKVFGAGLFSVSLRGLLEGPAPWHILGHGSISILFWDIDVDVEETWGERHKEELPPIPILPILETELNKPDTWRALLPVGVNLLVSLRQMPAEEAALILHPVGVLHISQRALPLELKLDKVGTQKPNDVNRLSIAVTGAGLAKKGDALELFAPAQFQNFSDSDKLSRPAFAKERSGLDMAAAGDDMRSSTMARRVVRYEEIIIDNNYKRFQRRFRGYFGVLFSFFLNGAAVTKCELSRATQSKLQPFADKIEVGADTYTVALQSTNQAFSEEAVSFHSEASAREYLNQRVAANPALTDTIHVIPSTERAA
jgi:hypothetical protein